MMRLGRHWRETCGAAILAAALCAAIVGPYPAAAAARPAAGHVSAGRQSPQQAEGRVTPQASWPVRRHGRLVLAGNGTAYDLDSLRPDWDSSVGVAWTAQNIEYAPAVPGLLIAGAPYTTALLGTGGHWTHRDCVRAKYGGVPNGKAVHVGHGMCIRTINVRGKKTDGGHLALIVVLARSRSSLTLQVTVWRRRE